MRIVDPYDNYCSVILVVIVNEIALTTTTIDTIPDGMDPRTTLVLGAGIGGAVAAIVAIELLRRKL